MRRIRVDKDGLFFEALVAPAEITATVHTQKNPVTHAGLFNTNNLSS